MRDFEIVSLTLARIRAIFISLFGGCVPRAQGTGISTAFMLISPPRLRCIADAVEANKALFDLLPSDLLPSKRPV